MALARQMVNLTVRGRSGGKDGHGARNWEECVASLVKGRREGELGGRGFRPRLALGSDLVLGLHCIARDRVVEHTTFRALIRDTYYLFLFLDFLEDASVSDASVSENFRYEGGVENLPGSVWALFTEWLPTRCQGARLSLVYSQCARVVKSAAQEKFNELPPFFLLPPNPFEQRVGGKTNKWDKADDIDDEEYKVIGTALIARSKEIVERVSKGRSLLPDAARVPPRDGIPASAREPVFSREDRSLQAISFAQLWADLEVRRRFTKTAVLGGDNPVFLDIYPFAVSSEDIGLQSFPGGFAHFESIPIRIKILEGVLKSPIDFNKNGAIQLDIKHNSFRQQAQRLARDGFIDHIVVTRKNQKLSSNDKTLLALLQCREIDEALRLPKLGMSEQRSLLHMAIPTAQELLVLFALMLLRTGWNVSTLLAIKPSHWHRPHPFQGQRTSYAELFSRKGRAGGAMQWAQSSTNKPFAAFDVMRMVLAWTEPLRILVRQQIEQIESLTKPGDSVLSSKQKMDLRSQLVELKRLQGRTWLTILDDGRVADLDCKWTEINSGLRDMGITRSDGTPVMFSQEMTRRAWAAFVYEKSGANLLLTKLALGHSDFATLLTYIASQRRLVEKRRDWVRLQTVLLDQFQVRGATSAQIIREEVKRGRITDDEAKTLQSGRTLTSKGVLCSNPTSPDAEVDPSHKPGALCSTQNCLDGCGKAFVTLETAVHFAREISRLEHFQRNMDIIAWESSDYEEQLDGAKKIFGRYSPEAQKEALKAIKKEQPRPIFGAPSSYARRRIEAS